MVGKTRTILSLLALGMIGCGGNILEAATDELGGSDSETDTEDEIGDVETGTSSSSSSTDDDETTSDESTSEESSEELTSEESTSEESTSEESTSEESTSEESTDTVVNTACDEPVSFTILGIDAAEVSGFWIETMSRFGEGMVLSMAANQNTGVATYELDIPCDDTWHIWVRGIEEDDYDSFWARVDGQPNDWAIFELDCTIEPAEAAYRWTELNWRAPNADGCVYVEDPWVHDWGVGVHELELGYRESWAISKIWVTNTNGTPP
jgi:hypothetical protein